MPLAIATEPVPFTVDSDGVARVSKTRVTLNTVVYSVIGYYLRRRSEVDDYVQRGRQQAEIQRKQNESRFDPYGVRERLLARRAHKFT